MNDATVVNLAIGHVGTFLPVAYGTWDARQQLLYWQAIADYAAGRISTLSER